MSQDVLIQCVKTLHNNGPLGAEVQINKSAVAPEDCTITPESVSEQIFLEPSVQVDLVEEFTIHCGAPSTHKFELFNEISDPKEAHVIDPDPTNNSARTGFSVDVIGEADSKIVGFSCDVPLEIPVSQDVLIECVKTLHNNG
ncbi:MAG: hypothetical protein GTO22_27205, partial [Gemmatimonadales bacterium]|nr:hypothetical protein [Gemmatimonadales bacterium]